MIKFSPRINRATRESGSALLVALFLLVVVAALGTVAIKIGAHQQQTANLTLIEARADAAAFSALEYASYRIRNGVLNACPNLPAPVPIPAAATSMQGLNVQIQCQSLPIAGVGTVYDLIGTASSGVYGNPDFVQRVKSRRISDIPPGTW